MISMKILRGALCGAMLIALHQAGTGVGFPAQALKRSTPYADAKPIFDALRPELLPAELRDAADREIPDRHPPRELVRA